MGLYPVSDRAPTSLTVENDSMYAAAPVDAATGCVTSVSHGSRLDRVPQVQRRAERRHATAVRAETGGLET